VPHLRIIDADLAARCDARRLDRRTRYNASVARGDGRVPERAYGKYLLSGGILICPTCGGHFEARKNPWRDQPGGVYACSTRRRKPGMCDNMMAMPIEDTDDRILDIIEGHVLCPRTIEELLSLVDRGEADDPVRLTADRDLLQREVKNLVDAIAKGVAHDTVVHEIRQREAEIAKLDVKLRAPRAVAPGHRQAPRGADATGPTVETRASLRAAGRSSPVASADGAAGAAYARAGLHTV
jgi:hypothetical protein